MPGGDRRGPGSMGPMTGRRMGYCAGYEVPGFANQGGGGSAGQGFGRGFGFGRGGGRGFGRGFGGGFGGGNRHRHWWGAWGPNFQGFPGSDLFEGVAYLE